MRDDRPRRYGSCNPPGALARTRSVATRIGPALLLGTVVALGPGVARGEHHHEGMEMDAASPASSFAAGVGLLAARFDTSTYIGDYQGVVPSVTWMRGRYAASANLGLYRLLENGRQLHGIGDVSVAANVTILSGRSAALGASLPVSLPTGDHQSGLGMGHVMAMPMAWASWSTPRVAFAVSAGYGRALDGMSGHNHGVWPLVEPMNMEELTWSAGADIPLGKAIRAGLRTSGAIAIGMGQDRAVGGLRTVWTEGRVETAAELQAGITGDPFILRGLVETAVHF